jgi:hypothetical protein
MEDMFMFGSGSEDLDFFQIGFVVEDLDEAMDAYTRAFGVHWSAVQSADMRLTTPEGEIETTVQGCSSVEGPPFLELTVEPAGRVWPKLGLNHMGFWADNPVAARGRLEEIGFPALVTDLKHEPPLFSFHRSPSGTWIEVLDAAVRAAVEQHVQHGTSLEI